MAEASVSAKWMPLFGDFFLYKVENLLLIVNSQHCIKKSPERGIHLAEASVSAKWIPLFGDFFFYKVENIVFFIFLKTFETFSYCRLQFAFLILFFVKLSLKMKRVNSEVKFTLLLNLLVLFFIF